MTGPAHRIVIVGGGFGGLQAAIALKKAQAEVTLIDRRNFHLFQPLLYQVAMGGLSPANIASPLRAIVRRQKNTRVLLAEATGFDVVNRRVVLTHGELPYDTLILATGSRHHYFGHPEWESLAPGLKTIEDATEIRRRVLLTFEAAERSTDAAERQALLTFVIVGGGPTGVELAGALAELARHTLLNNFRSIDPTAARIILLEGQGRVLPMYVESLSAKAQRALEKMGVEAWSGAVITDVRPNAVTVKRGGRVEELACATVLWGAGVQASPLAGALAKGVGVETDHGARIAVGPDLTITGHPELFVIGDMASAQGADGKPLPGLAPVAMQQGRYVARVIVRRLKGDVMPPRPFRYWDKGTMATIGRNAAVVDAHIIRFSGRLAWLAWLFIHITFLIAFENRILVLLQWAWNYFSRNRSARLITQMPPDSPAHPVGLDGRPIIRTEDGPSPAIEPERDWPRRPEASPPDR